MEIHLCFVSPAEHYEIFHLPITVWERHLLKQAKTGTNWSFSSLHPSLSTTNLYQHPGYWLSMLLSQQRVIASMAHNDLSSILLDLPEDQLSFQSAGRPQPLQQKLFSDASDKHKASHTQRAHSYLDCIFHPPYREFCLELVKEEKKKICIIKDSVKLPCPCNT